MPLEGTDEEVEDWLLELSNWVSCRIQHLAALLPTSHPLGVVPVSGNILEELAAPPFILATGGCAVNGHSLMTQAGLYVSDVRVAVHDWVSASVLV